MAFGKKNNDAPAAAVEEEEIAAAEADASPLDSEPADAELGLDDAADEVPEEVTAPPAAGADALLSMFAESKEQVDDLSVLVDLAGDADLDDILEELRTLRAALGITDAYDDEENLAAAA